MAPAKAASGSTSDTPQCHVGLVTPRPAASAPLLRPIHSLRDSALGLRAAMDPPFKEVSGRIGRVDENGVSIRGPMTCE